MIGPMSWRKPQPHDQKKEKQGIPKVLRDPVSQAKDLQVGVERLVSDSLGEASPQAPWC